MLCSTHNSNVLLTSRTRFPYNSCSVRQRDSKWKPHLPIAELMKRFSCFFTDFCNGSRAQRTDSLNLAKISPPVFFHLGVVAGCIPGTDVRVVQEQLAKDTCFVKTGCLWELWVDAYYNVATCLEFHGVYRVSILSRHRPSLTWSNCLIP